MFIYSKEIAYSSGRYFVLGNASNGEKGRCDEILTRLKTRKAALPLILSRCSNSCRSRASHEHGYLRRYGNLKDSKIYSENLNARVLVSLCDFGVLPQFKSTFRNGYAIAGNRTWVLQPQLRSRIMSWNMGRACSYIRSPPIVLIAIAQHCSHKHHLQDDSCNLGSKTGLEIRKPSTSTYWSHHNATRK